MVAEYEQLPHMVEHSWHSASPSAWYMRDGHAAMQLLASLKGVPVAGQVAQSLAVPPTHCSHVGSHSEHSRTVLA